MRYTLDLTLVFDAAGKLIGVGRKASQANGVPAAVEKAFSQCFKIMHNIMTTK